MGTPEQRCEGEWRSVACCAGLARHAIQIKHTIFSMYTKLAAWLLPQLPIQNTLSSQKKHTPNPALTLPSSPSLPFPSQKADGTSPTALLPCSCYLVCAALFSQLCVKPKKNAMYVKTPSHTNRMAVWQVDSILLPCLWGNRICFFLTRPKIPTPPNTTSTA